MDIENLHNIQNLMEQTIQHHGKHAIRAKVALMSEYDLQYPKRALPDPYYGGDEGFERVLDQCESSSQAWVKHLQQQFNQNAVTTK